MLWYQHHRKQCGSWKMTWVCRDQYQWYTYPFRKDEKALSYFTGTHIRRGTRWPPSATYTQWPLQYVPRIASACYIIHSFCFWRWRLLQQIPGKWQHLLSAANPIKGSFQVHLWFLLSLSWAPLALVGWKNQNLSPKSVIWCPFLEKWLVPIVLDTSSEYSVFLYNLSGFHCIDIWLENETLFP